MRPQGGAAVSRLHSEDGFSLIEVMFAVSIGLFVLMALFALLAASSDEGRYANRIILATNLANQFIEQARAMPFASVGTTGAVVPDVSGDLAASETVSYQGIAFPVTRQVTWVDDPSNGATNTPTPYDYKKFVLSISYNGGASWLRFSTYIRDSVAVLTGAPTVIWDPSVPITGSYVGGSLRLKAYAEATGSAGVISLFDFYQTENQTETLIAHWTSPGPNIWDVDTTPLPEGQHYDFKVFVAATGGGFASKTRTFYIDNSAPVWTSPVSLGLKPFTTNYAVYSSQPTLTLHYTPAADGSDNILGTMHATSYDVYCAYDTTPTYTKYGSLTSTADLTGNASIATGKFSGLTVAPFNVYAMYLTPYSGTGLPGLNSQNTTMVVTPIACSATATATKGSTTVPIRFSWTTPPANLANLFSGTKVHYEIDQSSSFPAATSYPVALTGSTICTSTESAAVVSSLNYITASPGTRQYYQLRAWVLSSSNTTVSPIMYSEIIWSPSMSIPNGNNPNTYVTPTDFTVPN
jgi:type II secretory pathway pseudopilin PulG